MKGFPAIQALTTLLLQAPLLEVQGQQRGRKAETKQRGGITTEKWLCFAASEALLYSPSSRISISGCWSRTQNTAHLQRPGWEQSASFSCYLKQELELPIAVENHSLACRQARTGDTVDSGKVTTFLSHYRVATAETPWAQSKPLQLPSHLLQRSENPISVLLNQAAGIPFAGNAGGESWTAQTSLVQPTRNSLLCLCVLCKP